MHTDPGLQPGLVTGDPQLCFGNPVEAAHVRDRKLEIAKSKDRTGWPTKKHRLLLAGANELKAKGASTLMVRLKAINVGAACLF